MNLKQTKHELQNILSGKSGASYNSVIQTIARHLGGSKGAGPMAQEKHQNKHKETKKIIQFAENNNLILQQIEESKFISSGAEQKVYIKNDEYVIKLNDAIFYASWQDYFHNLLFHNYFFDDTRYQLLGFLNKGETLYEAVKQPYIKADKMTNVALIKEFLTNNGFINNRNHDYYHPELGIILEDLHDENVLTANNILYFIDTVFYIDPKVFWD